MRVVLMGPPGAGKGTQAAILADREGLAHVSTGEMLRRSAEAGHPLGLAARDQIGRGEFVSDEIALGLVDDRISQPDAARGFILDGFPRTPAQAGALDAMLAERGAAIDAAVELRVDEAALVARIEGRAASCRARGEAPRTDDTAEFLVERMRRYRALTEPVLAFYRDAGRLAVVDGMQAEAEVARLVRAAITRLPSLPQVV